MTRVSQVEEALKTVMEERACVEARETGCIQRERAFNGADVLQTLVLGWLTRPDASLETLASTAAMREVYGSATAMHKRLKGSFAQFLHAILDEVVRVPVQAEQAMPLELLRRFSSVVLEDRGSSALLKASWRSAGRAVTDIPETGRRP